MKTGLIRTGEKLHGIALYCLHRFFLETMLSLPSKLQLLLFLNSLVNFFKVTHSFFPGMWLRHSSPTLGHTFATRCLEFLRLSGPANLVASLDKTTSHSQHLGYFCQKVNKSAHCSNACKKLANQNMCLMMNAAPAKTKVCNTLSACQECQKFSPST